MAWEPAVTVRVVEISPLAGTDCSNWSSKPVCLKSGERLKGKTTGVVRGAWFWKSLSAMIRTSVTNVDTTDVEDTRLAPGIVDQATALPHLTVSGALDGVGEVEDRLRNSERTLGVSMGRARLDCAETYCPCFRW
jgi:hypothetical protein